MQGAAGMIPQPEGWLRSVAEITRSHKAHLIADEVMTGFGRTSVEGELFCDERGRSDSGFCGAGKRINRRVFADGSHADKRFCF